MTREIHPLKPFLPSAARLLILGSFPPSQVRWSMDFFYPNFQNDMWRIMGIVFYGDKEYFTIPAEKRFDKERVEKFCVEQGIAMFDTACEVVRLKDNASDKFLQIVRRTDIVELLTRIPDCRAIVVTGELATSTLCETLGCEAPAKGQKVEARVGERDIAVYRMPSSSRAYPMRLEEKAKYYDRMFKEL